MSAIVAGCCCRLCRRKYLKEESTLIALGVAHCGLRFERISEDYAVTKAAELVRA